MKLIRDPFHHLTLMVERAIAQMGRERSDQIVIHSSIALLQERFRQLQRVKEMRQGRELLLRTLSESERLYNPTAHDEPSKLFFKSEILNPPPRPPCQVYLSLWPNSQVKHSSFRGVETPEMMKSWPTDKPLFRAPPIKFNNSDSDVDTSLHL